MAFERWQEFEDEKLVVAALLGDIAAFDVLVLRYRPAVLAAVAASGSNSISTAPSRSFISAISVVSRGASSSTQGLPMRVRR